MLTTGATPGSVAKSDPGSESTAAIAITTLTPNRVQAALRYTREDAAVLPMLDESLRENLSGALASELDKLVLRRTGTNKGLATFGTAPTKSASGVSNWQHAITNIYAGVDGLYAINSGEIRLLITPDIYAALGGELVDTSVTNSILGIERLEQSAGGVRTSANMPARVMSGADQPYSEALVIKGPPRRNAVAAVWENIDLVVDPYTAAEEGEVIITAYALADSAVLRTAGFRRVRFG